MVLRGRGAHLLRAGGEVKEVGEEDVGEEEVWERNEEGEKEMVTLSQTYINKLQNNKLWIV